MADISIHRSLFVYTYLPTTSDRKHRSIIIMFTPVLTVLPLGLKLNITPHYGKCAEGVGVYMFWCSWL